LENFNSAYPVNVDDLTIEHIMPQTLTQGWKDQLGLNFLEIHKKYLHTLGNLSLTGKNSELSNNSFEDKQRIDFQTSKLKLNFDLENLNHFNEQTILDRANSLATIAINIWSFPVTTYFKDVPEEQLYDLTSEDSFSGSKPFNLYLSDEKVVQVKTWRDLLRITCGYFYNFSPTEFIEIQNGQEFKWYFDTSKPLRHPIEFAQGKFVEGNMSANSIIWFLKTFATRMNYEPDKITFSIKYSNVGNSVSE